MTTPNTPKKPKAGKRKKRYVLGVDYPYVLKGFGLKNPPVCLADEIGMYSKMSIPSFVSGDKPRKKYRLILEEL